MYQLYALIRLGGQTQTLCFNRDRGYNQPYTLIRLGGYNQPYALINFQGLKPNQNEAT